MPSLSEHQPSAAQKSDGAKISPAQEKVLVGLRQGARLDLDPKTGRYLLSGAGMTIVRTVGHRTVQALIREGRVIGIVTGSLRIAPAKCERLAFPSCTSRLTF